MVNQVVYWSLACAVTTGSLSGAMQYRNQVYGLSLLVLLVMHPCTMLLL